MGAAGVRRLGELHAGLATPRPGGTAAVDAASDDVASDIVVDDISLDSRTVATGGLFLACAGRRTHGLAALPQALARGARAVLWEPAPDIAEPSVPDGVTALPIKDLTRHASEIASRFFGRPSSKLAVTGITGTNGKTTTAWLVAQALSRCRLPAAYMGTLGVGRVPEAIVPGEYTTADAVSVQRQLAAMQAAGAQCVAMEVSSHALDQQRVAAVSFRVVAFTNLTRDHLDYHGSMKAYGAVKARLFDMPHLGCGVINVDDAFGATLARRHANSLPLVLTARTAEGLAVIDECRGIDGATRSFTATQVRSQPEGLRLTLEAYLGEGAMSHHEVALPLIGEFNVDNVLVTVGILDSLGVTVTEALAALASISAPPGRMEAIVAPGRALAIVDYAHTPDALAKALRAARSHCSGRLNVVFGCGGDRDAGKRPLMASVAAAMADDIVITDDNPRSEPAAGIVDDILAGLPQDRRATVIHDRGSAIRHALEHATAGDVVLIAGKGHEDYQLVGAERRHFSDRELVQSIYRPAALQSAGVY